MSKCISTRTLQRDAKRW